MPISLVQDTPLVQLRFNGGNNTTAPVDSATPVTVIEVAGGGGQMKGELRLQDSEAPAVTRFIFRDLDVYDVAAGPIGLDSALPVHGILGANLLRNFAVRITYGASPAIILRDEIPDTDAELASDCDPKALLVTNPTPAPRCLAVFNTPPVGGGLLDLGAGTFELPATRLVIPACLLPGAFDATQPRDAGAEQPSGVSANAVVATGLGISILSRTALERLRATGATLQEDPPVTLHLPYGEEKAPLVHLARTAVVSDQAIELGACGELARRRRLLVAGRTGLRADDRDQNGAGAAIIHRAVSFAVLDDTRPLLQGLRQELAPFVGDIDVILGGSFLRSFAVDLDYPGGRVILQCGEGLPAGSCEVLPFCSGSGDPRCPGGAQ